MAKYPRFYSTTKIGVRDDKGKVYIDYKNVEDLKRLVGANGKIQPRQRSRLNAMEQRKARSAIKRARFMALLPYDSEGR